MEKDHLQKKNNGSSKRLTTGPSTQRGGKISTQQTSSQSKAMEKVGSVELIVGLFTTVAVRAMNKQRLLHPSTNIAAQQMEQGTTQRNSQPRSDTAIPAGAQPTRSGTANHIAEQPTT